MQISSTSSAARTSSTAGASGSLIEKAKTVGRNLGADFTKAIDDAMQYDGDYKTAMTKVTEKVASGELSEDGKKTIYAGITSQMSTTASIKSWLSKLSEWARKKYDFGA
jgi:hypothetical protein